MTDFENARHSKAQDVELIADEDEKARREALNAIIQTDRVKQYVIDALHGDRRFRLRPSTVLDLNRCAIMGLNSYAGNWRPASVEIGMSKHEPPDAFLVPELVEDMCDYVNKNWDVRSAVHLASFVMWRLNWIHPFTDGNGRTARAVSYMVLCVRAGSLLIGSKTIPEQIVENRGPYYNALEAADRTYEESGIGDRVVEEMEALISGMLAAQLKQGYEEATGEAQ